MTAIGQEESFNPKENARIKRAFLRCRTIRFESKNRAPKSKEKASLVDFFVDARRGLATVKYCLTICRGYRCRCIGTHMSRARCRRFSPNFQRIASSNRRMVLLPNSPTLRNVVWLLRYLESCLFLAFRKARAQKIISPCRRLYCHLSVRVASLLHILRVPI